MIEKRCQYNKVQSLVETVLTWPKLHTVGFTYNAPSSPPPVTPIFGSTSSIEAIKFNYHDCSMPTEKIKKQIKMVLIHEEEGMSSEGHTPSRGEGDDLVLYIQHHQYSRSIPLA
jgi:hypothetical protein